MYFASLLAKYSFIPFPNKFEKENRDGNLIDKLTTEEELSGLFNLAVQGLVTLLDRGYFDDPPSTLSELDAYLSTVDTVRAFVEDEDEVIIGEGYWVFKSDLYNAYKNYILTKPVSKLEFVRRIRMLPYNIGEGRKKNKHVWTGIGVVDNEF